MNFFHISHNDLDGYGCQFVSKRYYPNGTFFNCNYGLEVKIALGDAYALIEQLPQNEEVFLLITDLNPTFTECKEIDKKINSLRETHNIKLQLLDHHISGEKNAEAFEWYFLDVSRSATKITYDYFNQNLSVLHDDEFVQSTVGAINSVDIWLENESDFEFGKVMMRMISGANEINPTLFRDQNRDFRLWLICEAGKFLQAKKDHIELDDNIHFFKKIYIGNGKKETLDNLCAEKLVQMLYQNQENLSVFYGKHKGLVSYALGNISIPANAFLKQNPDFAFFIDVGKKGNVSMRAAGVVDVALLASKIANGGGHKNASGGKFDDFAENMNYESVRGFVQKKINERG